jgi:hypothetical protein
MENETRVHPIWKEVALDIVARIETEGYGFMIEHKDLFDMLEIKEPKTINEAMKQRLEILEKVENVKSELLYNHNVLLFNEFNKGYKILNPDDQVTKGYDRQFDKARKKIHKAIDVLNYVNHELLSQSGTDQRDRNLGKAVFVLSAFNKRRIPEMKRKAIS